MSRAIALARHYGIDVQLADLGDWGVDELRSEYDPDGPAIRINMRVLEETPVDELGEFILLAIGHEMYHHREAIGEVTRLTEQSAREAAANAYASSLLPIRR